jgi:putative zincin peptidase
MSFALIDRFHPQTRRKLQDAIDAGQLRKLDTLELLVPEQIRTLAWVSLLMLIGGSIFFVGFNIVVYIAQTHVTTGSIGGWPLLLWIGINIVGSIIILPIHEVLHGLAITFWGGIPHYGAKLPFALYCGAKDQLFHRNAYLVVALTPIVVITLAAILFTLLSPILASYTLLASISNFSGAAGDVWMAAKLWRQPKNVLVEDTEAGYAVWEISMSQPGQHEGGDDSSVQRLPSCW